MPSANKVIPVSSDIPEKPGLVVLKIDGAHNGITNKLSTSYQSAPTTSDFLIDLTGYPNERTADTPAEAKPVIQILDGKENIYCIDIQDEKTRYVFSTPEGLKEAKPLIMVGYMGAKGSPTAGFPTFMGIIDRTGSDPVAAPAKAQKKSKRKGRGRHH